MKKIYTYSILSLVLSLFLNFSFAVNTNISGVINSYAAVTAVGTNSIDVGGFSPSYTPACGDRIMLIQMKGASISTGNNSSFGNISNANNAGNYEILTIENVSGGTLTFTTNIGSYTVSGLVQAVYIPRYEEATVTGTLTAMPWNGTTGGVIGLEADGTITLNAGIDASSQGFRGGDFHTIGPPAREFCFLWFYNYNVGDDWVYNFANRSYAVEKGESISTHASIWGKGKLANGGGGGGVESGGGGGGSNFGSGGDAGGGNPASSTACGSTDVGGRGGASLNSSIASGKIFLGGGSGAGNNGNTNNYYSSNAEALPAQGRNGGGIIYIGANELIGNGNAITANGEDGYTPPASVNNFGGSGGGAGGSVLVDANIVTGSVTVEAKGGFGSTVRVTTTSSRRRGAGGGGGGGIVWFSSASTPAGATVDVSGGARGLSYYNTNTLAPSHYGTVGSAGGSLTGLNVNSSTFTDDGLVSATASATNAVNAGEVLFSNNGTIAKLDANGNNLGSTSITVTTGSTGPFTPSTGCGAINEHYMPRVYEITPTTQPITSCNVSLYVTQAELNSFIALTNGLGTAYDNCWGAVNSINDLVITAHHSSSSKEIIVPTATYLSCPDAWRLDFAVSEFSTFYIHSNGGLLTNNLLPVELIEFDAKSKSPNVNVLEWTTATEVNNFGFEVLRSYDGVQFEKIGWVDGHGNSTEVISYEFEDVLQKWKNIPNIYYKLKQVDYNEEFEFSNIEVVHYQTLIKALEVKVYPNPAKDFVQIESNGENIETVHIIDNTGRLVQVENGVSSNFFKINTKNLNPGTYFLRIISDGGVVTSKLQVSH